MKEEVAKFWNIIDQKDKDKESSLIFGTIIEVNEDERTCVLEVGDIKYEDVRLYALVKEDLKGFYMVPKKDSIVLASRINQSNELFILMFSEVDKIIGSIGDKTEVSLDEKELSYKNDKVVISIKENKVSIDADEITFNGGDNNGLPKVKELEDNLKALKDYVEAVNTALPSAFTAVGAAMAAVGANGTAAYQGSMAGKVIVFKNMENDKVKH